MQIFVDATRTQALWRVWGMTLLERVLRQLAQEGATRVAVHGPAGWRGQLRADFPRARIELVDVNAAPLTEELVLRLDAAAVFDRRVLAFLMSAAKPTRLTGTDVAAVTGRVDVCPVVVDPATLPSYIKNLRRYQPPYVWPIESTKELQRVEREMFAVVYKGVTDVVTKYVYPGLVRVITKWLAPTRITPNQVTAVSMVLSFGAIPVFLAGHLGVGVVMGLVMSVLDSVDGKLARLTLRESTTGNWMDHGSDTVYFGAWLIVVGYVAGEGPARWLLFTAWVLDRLIVALFHVLRKRELNDWGPIDAAFRLVVIRRNIFLLVVGAGVLVGRPAAAVWVLAAWTVFGVAFHTARAFWILATGEPPRASRLHGEAS